MTTLHFPDVDLQPFFEQTPDLVCIAGKDGYFRNFNHSVVDRLGYTKEELMASPIATFIHPEDREETARERERLLNGQPLVNFQNRYVAKNGQVCWLHWTSIYFPDREMVFAIAKDVTQRKQLERETEEKYVKFKSLATHFKSSMEMDRKYLAGELHEEVAQLAAVVKMEINWLASQATELSEASRSRLEHAKTVSDLLINAIQRISFSISPKILEDLGLDAALTWLCKEFGQLNGIPCSFVSAYETTMLDREMSLDFFRICQEAMRTIMLHASASAIIIRIDGFTDGIMLGITYQGNDPKSMEPQSNMWKGIRERAVSINGEWKIESRYPGITSLFITVPVGHGSDI